MDRAAVRPAAPLERRHAGRRIPDHREPLARLRLRAGREMTVLDISDQGALVEGSARLLPGTHVDVHVVTTNGRVLVRSRVVRAWIGGLEPDGPTYRGALAFRERIDTSGAGYVFPVPAPEPAGREGTAYPEPARASVAIEPERSPA